MTKILFSICCQALMSKQNYNLLIDGACGSFPCVHGTCTSNSTIGPGYNCSCSTGWTGQQCETGKVYVKYNCAHVYNLKTYIFKFIAIAIIFIFRKWFFTN